MCMDDVVNEYEQTVSLLANSIASASITMKQCRVHLYTFIVNNVSPECVFGDLCKRIIAACPNDVNLKHSIVAAAAHYEHLCLFCERPIYHYEAFIANVMTIIESYSNPFCKS